MDPSQLIGPSSPLGAPAPYWFLVAFKVLGLTLHMVPMHLWYAGLLVALVLRWGGGDARLFSDRFMHRMPILVAYGVNLGIVPLLFTQVAYYKAFYPATILMAWPWFSVFVLLTVAYYGVYIYSSGLREGATLTSMRLAAGWGSAIFFLVIGFIFANAFSLMTNIGGWPRLWVSTNVGGAVTGLALNGGDPVMWPRWLLMFGLALTTTAAYAAVDATFTQKVEQAAYRRWASVFAVKLYAAGIIWCFVTGSWYVWRWPADVRAYMFSGPTYVLTVVTALSPLLVWTFIVAQARRADVKRGLTLAVVSAQLVVLGLNAIARQVVQNLELRRYFDVAAEPVHVEWSPLILFLIVFVAGVAVLLWILKTVLDANQRAGELHEPPAAAPRRAAGG